jgi:hypothetical protein
MSVLSEQLRQWKIAAAELGFKIEAPFTLETPKGTFQYFARLPEFGSGKGMLVSVGKYDHDKSLVAIDCGYGVSNLSEHDEPYDRRVFVDMLSDWRWTGPAAEEPKWLVDKPEGS